MSEKARKIIEICDAWAKGDAFMEGDLEGLEESIDRVLGLESAVIEAAIAWREGDKKECGDPYWETVDDLRKAADALLAEREGHG